MAKLVNKIIFINNRRTSMRLCLKEWEALSEICHRENIARNKLIEIIEDKKDEELGLTYSTRLFIVMYYRRLAAKLMKRQLLSRHNDYRRLTAILEDIAN